MFVVEVTELDLGHSVIKSSMSIKILAVTLYDSLSMKVHVSNVCKAFMYDINWIRKILRYLTIGATKTLVQAYVVSRLDYCNYC